MTEKKRARHKTQKPALSAREVRFCVGFADHGNRTRAYREAGFEVQGRDENAVTQAARYLLRKSQIREYIRELQTEAMDEAKVTVGRLVQALSRIAFANRADLFDERGRLLPPRQWPKDVAGVVEGIDTEDLYEVTSERGQPKRKELIGHARKVRTAKRTEAIKILAQWKRMIGRDAEAEAISREIAELRAMLDRAKNGGVT